MVKIRFVVAAIAAGAIAVLIGCQTAKPALVVPAQSEIQVESSGFSPAGGAGHSTIEISLLFGNSDAIKTWTVDVVGGNVVRKSWTGGESYLPASLSWDGKGDGGDLAPEGTYTARLSIEYAKTYQPVSLESTSFVLDVTPPRGTIAVDPPQFIPSDAGVTGPVTLTINAASPLARMNNWSLDVYDQAGGLVKSFSGAWPNATAAWDGSSLNGGFVSPATTYQAVATVHDEYGNSSRLSVDVPVSDIPLATQETTVRPRLAGFSPRSDTLARSIDLVTTFGNRGAVKSWKLSLSHPDEGVQRTWKGDASDLPQMVTWDGTTDSGAVAPDGAYTAVLSVDYGNAYKPVLVKSVTFILDVTPPTAGVSANPTKLTADGKGGIQPVAFTVFGASAVAEVKSWSLSILSPDGSAAASLKGAFPSASASWDGTLAAGGMADPTRAYTYVATVRDEFGNNGEVRGSLATGERASVQGQVNIVAKSVGFSPNGDQVSDTMSFGLSYGQPSAVVSWKVTVSYPGLGAQKTFMGGGSNLPAALTWDGKTDGGQVAIDGTYTATLAIDYGTAFQAATATSAPFVLDGAPPTASIALSSPLFSPLEASDTITLTLSAGSPVAKIDSWTMDIYDPGGNVFRSFSGKWPANQVVWDGKGINGDLVQSAEDYPVVAKVRDQFGNVGQARSTVPVDILVEKMASGFRILASRIFFKAFTADYTNVDLDLAAQNRARLDALAERLKKFPGYQIRIVGHAVMIYWDNPAKGKIEQDEVLIPLSKARAEAVKSALIERGLDAAMFATDGVGAADQMVPDSDYKDRWQNRRVALFIEKK